MIHANIMATIINKYKKDSPNIRKINKSKPINNNGNNPTKISPLNFKIKKEKAYIG